MTKALTTNGPVLLPGTNGFDEEATGYQLNHPHRPSLIAGITSTQDVRDAVAYANRTGAKVAVQFSGHGRGAGLEGGVLISTRRMSGVRVDPQARTAWVEAGASWQQVVDATAPHGLAPLSGSSPGVGAVSYTLNGGIGLLGRRYGYASDWVRRFELVTADGGVQEVTPGSELFWALRGGGGSFGMVTGMEIGLVPVARLYGGGLTFDLAQAPDIMDVWHEWTRTVPEDMTSAVSVLSYPDAPMFPEHLRGRHVAQVQISYAGSAEDGARLVRPLRAAGPVLADKLRELPFVESGEVFDEPKQPHPYRSEHRLLNGLDSQALAKLVSLAGPSAPAFSVIALRHLGGALARSPEIPSAVAHRDAAYSLHVLSIVDNGEEVVRPLLEAAMALVAGQAIGRLLAQSFGPMTEDHVRSAFAPGDWPRLTALKAQVDPDRRWHVNHPIPGRQTA
ncbi:FAD-binding oxidoreductase [Amycolatopsis sp. NPDC003676]